MNTQHVPFKHTLVTRAIMSVFLLACGSATGNAVEPGVHTPCCVTALDDDNGWANAFAARVRAYDALFQYLVRTYGPPIRCRARDLRYFDEKPFGTLRFEWQGGVIFELTSMPPESSEITLRNSRGFSDQEKLITFMREYTKERGIPISYDHNVTRPLPTGAVTVFESSDPGVNASVRLEKDTQGRLVGIVLLLAL